jgi:putative membrane protein
MRTDPHGIPSLCLSLCAVVVFMSPAFAQAIKSDAQSFLEQVAEGQQIAISLGQLATQRAQSERVKEFGAQMVDDHKKAGQQVEQLAMKAGLQLSPGVSEERKHKINTLSQLFGHVFDRAYINYILEDHEATLDDFQRRMKTIRDQDIKEWIASILPTLQSHREKALVVKYALQTNP